MLDIVMLLNTADPDNFCYQSANVWRMVGYVMMVFKIVIPIILIIMGMVDLGKAVVSSKEDEIKKSTQSLLKRAIAGIIIFFIPTIIGVIFNLVDNQANWRPCSTCISNPTGNTCREYQDCVEEANWGLAKCQPGRATTPTPDE